ncbi:YciI-like protein [Salmonella enterica subsp. enterica serovar Bovismorbificans]|nr:YciI-like protein [Salmonella enterica subsp. enterica serovar Bovismorbificans]
MLYVIYAQDNANSLEKRLSVRPAHLARLQLLHDEGRLLPAPGRCPQWTVTILG